jgi:uncharacterized delta-60 repeat protein
MVMRILVLSICCVYSIHSSTVSFNDIAIQSDGNIVTCGASDRNTLSSIILQRYTVDGEPDPTFNTTGRVELKVGTSSAATSVQIQTDDKILIAGRALVNNTSRAVIARYDAQGTLDTTFGSGGIVTLENAEGLNGSKVIISSGDIILVGTTVIQGLSTGLIARYTSEGSLDGTFGVGGIVTTPLGVQVQLRSVGIQSDGKIIVGGTLNFNSFLFIRYTTNGTLDTTFGIEGFRIVQLGIGTQLTNIQVYSNDTIVSCGSANRNVVLVRIDSDGLLDGSFGIGGIVETPLETISGAQSITIQASDMALLVAGFLGGDIVVLKYLANGSIDTSFGTGGLVTYLTTEGSGNGIEFNLSGTGILTVGLADSKGSILQFGLAGALAVQFGDNGVVTYPPLVPLLNTNYIAAYMTQAQTVTSSFSPIAFDLNGPVDGWEISGGGTIFTCKKKGVYVVRVRATYTAGVGLLGLADITLRATVNGTELPGSQVSSTIGTTLLERSFLHTESIVQLKVNDQLIIQTQRTGTIGTIQLAPSGGGTTPIGSTILIERIA